MLYIAKKTIPNHNYTMVETLFPLDISQYVIGGLLVGVGISSVFILTGRVAGASTVLRNVPWGVGIWNDSE